MCRNRIHELKPVDSPGEGRTVRLNSPTTSTAAHCRSGFPWWVLWTIWPFVFLLKSAAYLFTPFINWLNQPLTLSLTPLPFLLIGAGIGLLIFGALRRGNRE